ncbi:MAG: TIGR03557 family F420-dependent LLM class oxidoreductase [Halobacteriota archaeon]
MNVKFGFRAVTEEYPPEQLIKQIIAAENAGFDFVTISDHFHPWFHVNAQASQAWIVLAAAASITKKVELGTGVTSPFSRYHPGIIAQSFATLQCLAGERIFLTVGTGEAMNEIPLGLPWLSYAERAQQLREAIEIIKMLWSEAFVTFEGKFFTLANANLYTKPKNPPKLYLAASGPKSAKAAGKITDGIYTFPASKKHYLEKLFPAFEQGVKESGKSAEAVDKGIEFLVSYDPDYDKALKQLAHWRSTLVTHVLESEEHDPRILQAEGERIPMEELTERWLICTKIEDCLPELEEYIKLGFTRIEIHSRTADPKAFATDFTQNLAYLKELIH